MAQPYRSMLYVPASNARAMAKAPGLGADALICDLEDAVAPDAKPAARAALCDALAVPAPCPRIVRINALATPWGHADACALAGAGALALPKVAGPGDLDALAALAPDAALWAMIETPLGVLNAPAIAAHPRVAGLIVGTNDLAADLGLRARADRAGLMAALGACVLAARAHGRVVIDGVFNGLHDPAGLRAECAQGRDLGFDGKSVIHPGQIAAANAAFAPQPDEITEARRLIAVFEAAAPGQGVAVLDGRIVEALHVVAARALIARADAIAARDGAR